MSTLLKCNYKCENYNTLHTIDGNFKFSDCDVEFLLPKVTNLNFKADRITFTKVLNIKKQVLKIYKDNELYNLQYLIHHCASSFQVFSYLKQLFSGTNLNLTFVEDKLTYLGMINIKNPDQTMYEIEADKTLLFCLGLLELKDIKGIIQ